MAKKKAPKPPVNGGGKPSGGRPAPRPKKKAKGGKGGVMPIVIAAILTIAIGIALIVFYGDRLFGPEKPKVPQKEISLYFSNDEGEYLVPEKITVNKGTKEDELKAALGLLVSGPKAGLEPAIPAGTRVLGVSIKDNIAYVDFSKEIIEKHQGGSAGEIQTIYSIVNSVSLNYPELKEVQILVEGKKEQTIAGHIDISQPLKPDMKLVR